MMRMRSLCLVLCLLLMAPSVRAEALHFVTEELPPFSFSQGALVGGAITEIAQAVCQHLNYECIFAVYPWRRSLQLAEAGVVDAILTVIDSPERQQAFHLTPMIVTSRYDIYSLHDNDFEYRQPSDMSGQVIGVHGPSGTSFVLGELLKEVKDVKVQMTINNQRLILMLNAGRFGRNGLVVLNSDVASHLTTHNESYRLRHAGQLAEISYGIGFSRKKVSEAQFEAFTQGLRQLTEYGDIAAILQAHGLSPAQP
jgi:polar amino acid transport system substrate-binding protein